MTQQQYQQHHDFLLQGINDLPKNTSTTTNLNTGVDHEFTDTAHNTKKTVQFSEVAVTQPLRGVANTY